MHLGHVFDAWYRAACRRIRLRQALADFLVGGLLSILLASVSHLLAWIVAPDLARETAGIAWRLVLPVSMFAGVIGSFRSHRSLRTQVFAETSTHREEQSHALLAAAASSPPGQGPPRLLPLLLSMADQEARTTPLPPWKRLKREWCSVALAAAVLSFLLHFLGARPSTTFGLFPTGSEDKAIPALLPGSEDRSARPTASKNPEASVSLEEVARLQVGSTHQIHLLGREIPLEIRLTTLRGVAKTAPLQVVLAVADGLPSPDEGFGIGVHVFETGSEFRLDTDIVPPQSCRIELKTLLESEGIYGRGLFTVYAAARARDEKDLKGEILSNQIVLQVVENMERSKVRKPTPTAAQSRVQSQPKKEKDEQKGNSGGAPPVPSEPDPPPPVETKASAVKPLLSDGPTVEKEVSVFEREKGGEARVIPKPAPLPEALRSFSKRQNDALRESRLSAAESRWVEAYFEALLRRG